MIKRCSKCKRFKRINEFSKDSQAKDGLYSLCKFCVSENRRYYILRSYGIKESGYIKMLDDQNNCCAICYSKFENSKFRHIDHDHNTGKIRGILCNKCNSGIGCFRDNINYLYNAINYIRKNREWSKLIKI